MVQNRVMKTSKTIRITLAYLVFIVLFILFLIGRNKFSADYLTFTALYFAILLGVLGALQILKSLHGIIIVLVSFIIAVVSTPKGPPPQISQENPEMITESDKDLFAIGFGLGTTVAKVTHRFHDEQLVIGDSVQYALKGLLTNIGFPESERFIGDYISWVDRVNLDTQVQAIPMYVSEITDMERPLKEFVTSQYGDKGQYLLNLGTNMAALYRLLFLYKEGEKAERLKLSEQLITEYYEAIFEFSKIYMENIRDVAILGTGILPVEITETLNSIATADIGAGEERDRILGEMIEICFVFGISVSKRLTHELIKN